MPCDCTGLESYSQEWLKRTLCHACKYLTVEEIRDICQLEDWYVEHLLKDFSTNLNRPDGLKEVRMAQQEAARLGYRLSTLEDGTCMSYKVETT